MTAQFKTKHNQTASFRVDAPEAPEKLQYIHNCCPFGWGDVYELLLDRYVPEVDIALYRVAEMRLEGPGDRKGS